MKLEALLRRLSEMSDSQMVYPAVGLLKNIGMAVKDDLPDDKCIEVEVGDLRKLSKKSKKKTTKSEGTADDKSKVDEV